MRKIFWFLAGLGVFFFWGGICRSVRAVTLSLADVPASVAWDQEFLVRVDFEINAPNTTYYFRPCFYRQESTSYFGCVRVGENWVCDSQTDKTNYFPITTNEEGVWQGQILVLAGREEVGEFNFKLRRYTAGGSVFDSEPVVINLAASVLEITPTPSPTLVPSPSPSPTIATPTPTPSPTLAPTSTPTLLPTPTPQAVDYDNIFLNEVMANPDEGPEWVELYNGNDFPVNLENWFLDDLADGGSSPKKFSLRIEPGGYAVVAFDRAVFNNSGDEVRLLNCQKEVEDSFSYSKTIVGQSWGLAGNGWCLQLATPGEANGYCLAGQNMVTPTAAISLAETAVGQKGESENVLGAKTNITQKEPISFSPDLGTYLLADKPTSLSKKSKIVYSPAANKWLPSWLLFSWGFLSFGVGALRLIRNRFKNYDFGQLKN